MDTNISYIRFKAIITFVFLFAFTQWGYSTEVHLRPNQIFFDCTANSYEKDALTVCNETGGTAGIDWYTFDQVVYSHPVAYIKDQSAREIEVCFYPGDDDDDFSGTVHLIVKLSVLSGTGIGTICNQFYANYTVGSYIKLQLTGDLPVSVSKQTFTWKWEIYAIPVNATGYCSAWTTTNTTHTYYTVLAAPQAPMEQPWVSVLDKACVWANEQTTAADVLASLTNNLYNSGVTYNSDTHYTPSGFTDLNLGGLLSDLNTPSNVYMDCRDFSNFLQVLCNSLGVPCGYNRFVIQDYTYVIHPSGLPNPVVVWWNYHQVGWYNNSNVSDAATKIDSGDPSNPPFVGKLAVGAEEDSLLNYQHKLTGNTGVYTVGTGVCSVY